MRTESPRWYGRVPGKADPVPLSENRRAAEDILNNELGRAARQEHGLPDRHGSRQPLAAYLDEWEQVLPTRDERPKAKHVRSLARCVGRVLDGCGFESPADLDAGAVRKLLADLRASRSSVELPADRTEFRKAELAKLLGVTASTMPFLVARHKLPATGQGKARRYPRATAEALAASRGRGAGEKTSNMYFAAVKQFVRWLADEQRVPLARAASDLLRIGAGKADMDPRHARTTPLTADEFARLIVATKASRDVLCGLTGEVRALVYRLAVETGYRAAELSQLRPSSFVVTGELVEAVLPASATKNGQEARQPLGPSAGLVVSYLGQLPVSLPIIPGDWWKDAAEMIRRDQTAAGIPYVVEGPTGRTYRDFHNLRHTMVAFLDAAGASLKEAMQLARHSRPELTAKVY
ncbi:MAG TPA: hypothetical protein VKE40_02150 [Gemmataceae bacterium]|nr:hypothetical protein [Gemmataceae bacterium]